MNTSSEMVVRSPLGWEPVAPPPKHRLLGLTIALVLVFGIVALVLAAELVVLAVVVRGSGRRHG